MDSIGIFSGMFGDSDSMMLAVLVFLAAATLAFCVMAVVPIRGSVRRSWRASRRARRLTPSSPTWARTSPTSAGASSL